jgi:hypothetical protein
MSDARGRDEALNPPGHPPLCGCKYPTWTRMEEVARGRRYPIAESLRRHFADPNISKGRSDYVGRPIHPRGPS